MLVIALLITLAIGMGVIFVRRTRKRCGSCAFFDGARHLCLLRDITVGHETGGCITHKDTTE